MKKLFLQYPKTAVLIISYICLYLFQAGYLEEYGISREFIDINPFAFLAAGNMIPLFIILIAIVAGLVWIDSRHAKAYVGPKLGLVARLFLLGILAFMGFGVTKNTINATHYREIVLQYVSISVGCLLLIGLLWMFFYIAIAPITFIIFKIRGMHTAKFRDFIKLPKATQEEKNDEPGHWYYYFVIFGCITFLYGMYGIGSYYASSIDNYPAIVDSKGNAYAIIQRNNGYFVTEKYDPKSRSLVKENQKIFNAQSENSISNVTVSSKR